MLSCVFGFICDTYMNRDKWKPNCEENVQFNLDNYIHNNRQKQKTVSPFTDMDYFNPGMGK